MLPKLNVFCVNVNINSNIELERCQTKELMRIQIYYTHRTRMQICFRDSYTHRMRIQIYSFTTYMYPRDSDCIGTYLISIGHDLIAIYLQSCDTSYFYN